MLVSTTDDVAARVRQITGGAGAHAAIDSVGGDLSNALGDAVRDGGVVYVYGAMGGLTATASIPAMLFRGVTYTGFWLKVCVCVFVCVGGGVAACPSCALSLSATHQIDSLAKQTKKQPQAVPGRKGRRRRAGGGRRGVARVQGGMAVAAVG